jgi:hypothetical protein
MVEMVPQSAGSECGARNIGNGGFQDFLLRTLSLHAESQRGDRGMAFRPKLFSVHSLTIPFGSIRLLLNDTYGTILRNVKTGSPRVTIMRLTTETIGSLVFNKITFIGFHSVPLSASKLERDGEVAIGAVWEKLTPLSLKPRPKPQPYNDGQWTIRWSGDESLSRFSLDLQKELVGAQFFVSSWAHAKNVLPQLKMDFSAIWVST